MIGFPESSLSSKTVLGFFYSSKGTLVFPSLSLSRSCDIMDILKIPSIALFGPVPGFPT